VPLQVHFAVRLQVFMVRYLRNDPALAFLRLGLFKLSRASLQRRIIRYLIQFIWFAYLRVCLSRSIAVAWTGRIDATMAQYPETRKWAESLYAAYPNPQGLISPSPAGTMIARGGAFSLEPESEPPSFVLPGYPFL
jgi:hypothetical protein